MLKPYRQTKFICKSNNLLMCMPIAGDFSARRQSLEGPGTYALVRDWGERARATTLKIQLLWV